MAARLNKISPRGARLVNAFDDAVATHAVLPKTSPQFSLAGLATLQANEDLRAYIADLERQVRNVRRAQRTMKMLTGGR